MVKQTSSRVTLIRGDCVEVLSRFVRNDPEFRVDLVVTDIPYGSAERGIIFDSDKKVKNFSEGWDVNMPLDWLPLVSMLLSSHGSMFVFVPYLEGVQIAEVAAEEGLLFKRPVAVKIKATACYPVNRKNLASAFETCLFFRKSEGPFVWHGKNTDTNLWIDGFSVDRKRIHPTQKSVASFRRMIELTTNPGDLVLDPFAGSCVSGIAAMESDRNWIGVEKSLYYAVKGWELMHPGSCGTFIDMGLI